jgi:hypothetical protein
MWQMTVSCARTVPRRVAGCKAVVTMPRRWPTLPAQMRSGVRASVSDMGKAERRISDQFADTVRTRFSLHD